MHSPAGATGGPCIGQLLQLEESIFVIGKEEILAWGNVIWSRRWKTHLNWEKENYMNVVEV